MKKIEHKKKRGDNQRITKNLKIADNICGQKNIKNYQKFQI